MSILSHVDSFMSILSPGDSFAERVLFWILLLEKIKIDIKPFAYDGTHRMCRVFWVMLLEIVL